MNTLNKRIFELIGEANDDMSFGVENDASKDDVDSQNISDSSNDSKGDSENKTEIKQETPEDKQDDNKEDPKEEFQASTIDEFLKKTNTKVQLNKVSSEPSPIFGPNDTKNHNKYKITLQNENGVIWFYFWDSIRNTINNKVPSIETVMSCFGMDLSMVKDGISKDEFKKISGYDSSEDSLAQKAYDGCYKTFKRAQKLFSKEQINTLSKLSQEI